MLSGQSIQEPSKAAMLVDFLCDGRVLTACTGMIASKFSVHCQIVISNPSTLNFVDSVEFASSSGGS